VTARGSDACSAAGVTNTASATCPVITTPCLKLTHECPPVAVGPGDLLVYTGSVSNCGNVTLTNVVVTSDKPSLNTVIFTRASLAPGAVGLFTNSYVAPVACSFTKTLQSRATSICGDVVTSSSTVTCPIVTTPDISVNAACTSGILIPGGTATYTGTVRNAGDITLTNVRVVSDRPAANTTIFTVASLAPGASANFNGTYTVPAESCSVTANLSATGTDFCTGAPVTRTASATCPVTTAPAVTVTLTCPAVTVVAGAPITYTGTVRNSGNITLTNVTVSNAQSVPPTVFTVATLAPGASANFSASFTTAAGTCTVSSTATARGNDACTGNVATHSASATCPLTTTARLIVSQTCPAAAAIPGGVLTYSGTVSNAGTVALTNVILLNDRSGSTPVFVAATMVPGASSNFTASYTVPVNSTCSVTSILTASGADNCSGTRISVSATNTCPLLTSPGIEVTQVCPSSPGLQGSVLTYTGTVRNTGNITLSNIIVVSSRPAANSVVFTAATLAPGATANFTGSYIVPLNCCSVSGTLKATGRDICSGIIVSDTQTATCPVLTLPRLAVTKICSTEPWKTPGPGDQVEYSGTVSNSGNITLTGVTVVNDRPSANSLLVGPMILAPGEFANYTGSYTIPVDFCGTDTVTARGLDSCTDAPVTTSVTTTCPVQTTPRIAVTKNCPAQPTPYGGVFTFTGSVSNAGNVTLTNVFVTDSMPAANTPVIGPITLAPGASREFTGSFTAPLDCCEIMDTVTARGQDRCSGSRVSATASALCQLLTTPSLVVLQNCPTVPVAPGSLLTFTGSVSNSGNVNLTNVFVYNSESTTAVTGPLELAPGQTEAYTGSYVQKVKGTFGTIGLTGGITDRFGVPSNYEGLTFADPDKGYGATQFYSVHKDDSGPNYTFDTISGPGTITHRFSIVLPGIDSITFAAPDVGYGPLYFYYVRHDTSGVSHFGVIKPGGTVGTATDLFVAGPNFDAITFAAPDVGFGANLFYYLRHDSSGRSFFGTINPALPGTMTDRFSGGSIGSNFNALVFVSTDVGNGANRFYYLRTAAGASTMGYIAPTATAGVVADRFNLGRPFTELTFTTTDVGYGANLFYYLGSSGYDPARPDATGSASTGTGVDTCQGRVVSAVANCSGPVRPVAAMATWVTASNRVATIYWASSAGTTYRLQCKANLADPIWIDIPGDVTATGATSSKTDPMGSSRQRFYRVVVVVLE